MLFEQRYRCYDAVYDHNTALICNLESLGTLEVRKSPVIPTVLVGLSVAKLGSICKDPNTRRGKACVWSLYAAIPPNYMRVMYIRREINGKALRAYEMRGDKQ